MSEHHDDQQVLSLGSREPSYVFVDGITPVGVLLPPSVEKGRLFIGSLPVLGQRVLLHFARPILALQGFYVLYKDRPVASVNQPGSANLDFFQMSLEYVLSLTDWTPSIQLPNTDGFIFRNRIIKRQRAQEGRLGQFFDDADPDGTFPLSNAAGENQEYALEWQRPPGGVPGNPLPPNPNGIRKDTDDLVWYGEKGFRIQSADQKAGRKIYGVLVEIRLEFAPGRVGGAQGFIEDRASNGSGINNTNALLSPHYAILR